MSTTFVEIISAYGIYIFLINLGLSFIGASIAKKKGYSYGGFLCLGIFVAFWLSLIIVSSLKPKAGSIYQLRQDSAQPPAQQPPLQSARFCSECGAQMNEIMAFCPSCGKKNPAATTTW